MTAPITAAALSILAAEDGKPGSPVNVRVSANVALSILRECRDTAATLDRATIERLAKEAGVKVEAVHVDLTALHVERYEVQP